MLIRAIARGGGDGSAIGGRRKKARVPDGVIFKTKPEIALDRIGAARSAPA
jgi:hypothetical protein